MSGGYHFQNYSFKKNFIYNFLMRSSMSYNLEEAANLSQTNAVAVSLLVPTFLGFSECWTYLKQTWSGHIQSDPFLRSDRSPHDRQGWKCQNLMQKKILINTVDILSLHCCFLLFTVTQTQGRKENTTLKTGALRLDYCLLRPPGLASLLHLCNTINRHLWHVKTVFKLFKQKMLATSYTLYL